MKFAIKAACCIAFVAMFLSAARAESTGSGRQIVYSGGGEGADGVTVSETVQGTSRENYFDVEIRVTANGDVCIADVRQKLNGDVRFLYFYNSGGQAVSELSGEANSENDAVFSEDVVWDIENSAHGEVGREKTYVLKYAVRIANESAAYGNGQTPLFSDGFLTYAVDGAEKKLFLTSPVLEGYTGELAFDVEAEDGNFIDGAYFSLAHGRDCGICKGDIPMERVSAAAVEGKTVFESVPSGHTYTLAEDTAPEGYLPSEPMKVSVIFGETMLYNGEGMPVSKIVNAKRSVKSEAEEIPQIKMMPKTGEGGYGWKIAGVVTSAAAIGALAALAALRDMRKR